MPFGQAQDSRGRICAERYGELLNYFNEDGDNNDDEVCIQNYVWITAVYEIIIIYFIAKG